MEGNMGKKNIRKIPESLLAKVNFFQNNDVIVGCVKRIRKAQIERGLFSNQGLQIINNSIEVETPLLPSTRMGRYSKKNVLGYEKVLRDLPKIPKSWDIESPNFGDWSRGSHTITFTKMVYQRAFYSPKFLEILVEIMGEDTENQSYVVKFQVNQVLDRTSDTFTNDLFFNLNLLLEFSGSLDVFEFGASRDDFLNSLYVDWEILPPGDDETIERIIQKSPGMSPQQREEMVERYNFIISLHPRRIISGTSGFARYYGALFTDNLVVFENNRYGNASYIMFENWEVLSQRSRIDLLSSKDDGFIRIRHTHRWEDNLRKAIPDRMGDQIQES